MSSAPLCLNMIVKNEAHIVRRVVESALPHISRWCIVDTGSTDGTQDALREALAGVPGELHDRPWVNFAHNRTEALALARRSARPGEAALLLDADDVLEVEPGSGGVPEDADALCFEVCLAGGTILRRPGALSLRRPWEWRGALHEAVHHEQDVVMRDLPGWRIRSLSDSARNAEGTKKFLRDALVLERELLDHPNDPRHVFYLAQCYRDGGRHDRALEEYERRSRMAHFEEEAWYAAFQVGSMRAALGDVNGALTAYLLAADRRPSRAEPLTAAAALCRREKRWASARVFARAAMEIGVPAGDVLFIDVPAHTWRPMDEYGIACSWLGDNKTAVVTFERMLSQFSLPEADRARVSENLVLCRRLALSSPR